MIAGQNLTAELIKALRLPENTVSFTMEAHVDRIVSIKCVYYPDIDQDSLTTEIKRYRLVDSEEQTDIDNVPRETYGEGGIKS